MTATLAVCRRELAAMLGGPLGWVLLAVVALLTGYFFYSDLAFFVLFGGGTLHTGLWRYWFLDVRLVAMLVLPVVTMRLFAEERRQGTLELLWTLPVRDGQLVAGKFLAAFALWVAMLIVTLPGPLLLAALHPVPVGPPVAGYTGLLLLGAAFIAVGLAMSACTENQVVAAMLTYGILVFAWFVSWNEAAIGETLAPLLIAVSLFDRFYGFTQGTIDSRDVVFLLALTALFLFAALRALGTRTWRGLA
jgi:ABC-2 type transport system permease protein